MGGGIAKTSKSQSTKLGGLGYTRNMENIPSSTHDYNTRDKSYLILRMPNRTIKNKQFQVRLPMKKQFDDSETRSSKKRETSLPSIER